MRPELEDLVRPNAFLVFFSLFLVVGIISNKLMEDLGHGFSIYFFFYSALAVVFFAIGSRFTIDVPSRYISIIFILYGIAMSFGEYGAYSIPIIIIIYAIYVKWGLIERYCGIISVIGALFLTVNLVMVGALPAIETGIRFESQTVLMLFGYAFCLLGVNYLFHADQRKGIVMGSMVFIIVLLYGFRSYLLVFLLSLGTQSILKGNTRKWRLILGSVAVAAIIVIGGYLVVGNLDQQWHLSAQSLFLYRIGFTTHMFDEACAASGLWGVLHGEIWAMPSTSPLIGEYLTGGGNITTTIFGPIVLDGGVLEMPLVLFLGASVNTLYHRAVDMKVHMPLYAIFFSILLISIEISPIPIFFFCMLFVLMVVNRTAVQKAE